MNWEILVASKTSSSISLIKQFFLNINANVTYTSSGHEVKRILRNTHMDLLVIDTNLENTTIGEFQKLVSEITGNSLVILLYDANYEKIDDIIAHGKFEMTLKKTCDHNLIQNQLKAYWETFEMRNESTHLKHIQCGPFSFDAQSNMFFKNKMPLELTKMEQKILLYFLNNPNIVLTKKMILKEVWGSEFLSESTLTVHIASLRSKVETNPRKPSLIKTVWGEGYRLDFRSYEPVELDHEITTNDIDSLSDFERKANIICAQLNNYIDLKPTLETIVKQIRDELVDCNAMGIRLYNNGDYPYYVHSGFSKEFIEIENSLCVKDENGNWILTKDEKGYILDCMCGNIIRRNFDASLPFFTEQGSYWSNNTSTLLMKNGVNVIHDSKRGQCSSCRYESVALIPISINGECIGLIQLNDHRIGMFTENLIDCLQMIGEHIGMAIYNSMEYSNSKMYNLELLDENRKLKNRLEHITKLITTI